MSLARFFADHRSHNATVPADQQGDACTCPLCRAGYGLNSPLTDAERIAAGLEPADALPSEPAAPRAADPAAAILATPADAQRPEVVVVISNPDNGPPPNWPRHRGPVQDESGARDLTDWLAARHVEGRTIADDIIDGGAL